jgi:hypothetical protein
MPPTNQPLVKGKITIIAFFFLIWGLIETFMPNFSQIGKEMAILAYIAKLTNQLINQLTNQPLAIGKLTMTETSIPNFSQIG